MVNVQCRRGEKCQKAGCVFVHPGDPRWTTARSANSQKPERDHRGPPARRSSGSEWGTSTNTTPVKDKAKKWGGRDPHTSNSTEVFWNYDRKETSTPSVASTEGLWGVTSSKDSTFAPSSGDGGWNPGSGGWGTGNSSPQGSGWSAADGGWGSGNLSGQWGGAAASASPSEPNNRRDSETAKTGKDLATAITKPSAFSAWGSDKKVNDAATPLNLDPPSSWGQKTVDTTLPVNPVSPRLPDWSSVKIDAGNSKNRRSSTCSWSSVNEGLTQTSSQALLFDAKGKGKAKATDSDSWMRESSPVLMPPPPVPPVATSSLGSTRRAPPALKLDSLPYVSQSVDSPLYAPSNFRSPAIPTKLPTRLQPSSNSLTSAAQKMALAAKRNKSPSKPPGQKKKRSRRELYQSTLRHMQNAVISHIQLRKAQEDDDHWKRTQVSSIYGHATQATRQMLNAQRSQYSQRVISLKEELNREIFALSHFPDFSAPMPAPVDLLTKEMVAEYTQELKLWFQDLELHKRLLAGEDSEMENLDEVDKSSNNVDGALNNVQPQLGTLIESTEDLVPKPSDLAQQTKWTWKDLLKAADVVEQRLSDTEADFFFNAFTNISTYADDRLADLTTQLSIEEEVQELNVETRDIKDVSTIVQSGGKKLSSQALELTTLLARVDELQKELDQTTAERKYFHSVNEQAVKYYRDFEQWEKQDKARIASLTTQIRDLHLLRKRKQAMPPPPPHTVTTLPPSISMNVLLEYIKPIITNTMKSEIEVALSGLRSRCIENQHRLKEDLLEEANAISRRADLVRAQVQELKSMSLSGINAVLQGVLPEPTPLQPSH
ncbi:hypothetical protein CPB83DRAFT_848008 [Crepidotus variabilis]|uniref:Uncharacterized protein n=1 Tax=Crepidotus variabilis TaxID=179855 RepID=A0A9P6JTU6_9AGAR|nr:hypothetical protein CPB83DRAFT_848008 [Crepidotus variabilis]